MGLMVQLAGALKGLDRVYVHVELPHCGAWISLSSEGEKGEQGRTKRRNCTLPVEALREG